MEQSSRGAQGARTAPALRNYIGLASTFHDPAVAIVSSQGEVVFAEGTERYLQCKQGVNCAPDPIHRIDEMLEAYCEPGAELVVATTWTRPLSPHPAQWLASALSGESSPLKRALRLFSLFHQTQTRSMKQAGVHLQVRDLFTGGWGGRFKGVQHRAYQHHLTHAAAGCYSSGLEQAACAVADGVGEGSSTGFFVYEGGALKRVPQGLRGQGSIGIFFDLACYLSGFDPWKGEHWKVMGLAAYGKLDPRLYELLRSMLRVRGLRLDPGVKPWGVNRYWRELRAFRKPETAPTLESADVAFTTQHVFCELMQELLQNFHRLGLSDQLVLSGGCALNSAYNGKIVEGTGFKKVHIFCAPADDGNAVGAALLAYQQDRPDSPPPRRLMSPYLGSRMSDETLARLESFGSIPSLRRLDDPSKRGAELLAQGKIIGWVQGRAEFGPRALGNRSILADPRRRDIKDVINAKVKFREEYRPLAPAILDRFGEEYFEAYQPSPYMERALRFRPEVMTKVPGVVHVDGTGRLQTVFREWNPRYFELIEEFYRLTGIPLVLNTSFNVMGKPIIHSVEDAVAVFYSTGLDALIIENWEMEK